MNKLAFLLLISILQIYVTAYWDCGNQHQRKLEATVLSEEYNALPAEEASWLVTVEADNRACIGYLVGKRAMPTSAVDVVLSTKDCVGSTSYKKIKIRNPRKNNINPSVIKVKSVTSHPFVKGILIIKLKKPLVILGNWLPICVYHLRRGKDDCAVITSTVEKGKNMKEVKLYKPILVDSAECKKEIPDFDESTEFCVEGVPSGNDNVADGYICVVDRIWQLYGLRKQQSSSSKYAVFYDVQKTGFDTVDDKDCGTAAVDDLRKYRKYGENAHVPIDAAPWMVAIYVQGKSGKFCTGMLVNGQKHKSGSREVYTMSSCVSEKTKSSDIMVSYKIGPMTYANMSVASIERFSNKPAVVSLKLKQPISTSLYARPICLAKDGYVFSPSSCNLLSIIYKDGDFKVKANFYDSWQMRDTCANKFSDKYVESGDFCAKDLDKDADNAQTSSGNMIICAGKTNYESRWLLAGVQHLKQGNLGTYTLIEYTARQYTTHRQLQIQGILLHEIVDF
ncbi:Tryptase-2 [Trichinella pseudospiralis]